MDAHEYTSSKYHLYIICVFRPQIVNVLTTEMNNLVLMDTAHLFTVCFVVGELRAFSGFFYEIRY